MHKYKCRVSYELKQIPCCFLASHKTWNPLPLLIQLSMYALLPIQAFVFTLLIWSDLKSSMIGWIF